MNDFFRGWRRKAGCVTLVMACVISAVSFRSANWVIDSIVIPSTATSIEHLRSGESHLSWLTIAVDDPAKRSQEKISWQTFEIREPGTAVSGTPGIDWKFRFCGFWYGTLTNEQNTIFTERIVPYWSIVLTLTLVSAWLLLSKPKTSKPSVKPSPEPTA